LLAELTNVFCFFLRFLFHFLFCCHGYFLPFLHLVLQNFLPSAVSMPALKRAPQVAQTLLIGLVGCLAFFAMQIKVRI